MRARTSHHWVHAVVMSGILIAEAAFAQPAATLARTSQPHGEGPAPASVSLWTPTGDPERAAQVAATLAIDAKPGEVVDRRTPTSDVVVGADGTETTTLYSQQVYWKPANATVYKPIKVGFAPVAAGDTAEISNQAPVAVQVAPASDARGFLAVTIGGHAITYRPVATGSLAPTAASAPTVNGSLADVAEVAPGLAARILARADGAHVFFVLNSAADAAKISYTVDAPDLSLVSDKQGGYEFHDAKGALVARMPNPYAMDSTPDTTGLGSGRMTNLVSYAITGSVSPWTVTVTVDPTWLKAATYPVYVDPTIVNGGSSTYGDTFTNPNYPTTNFGNYCRPDSPYYCELWLGQSPNPTADVGSDLMRFDLTPVLATTIDSASLQIFPYHQYMGTSPMNTWVRQVTSSWTESTTYNTRPSVSGSGVVTGTTAQGSWSNFNVLGIVRNWVHASQANWGFQVDENGNNYTYWKRIISAEETGYPHPEKLVITNHVPTAAVVAPTGWTADPTVSWTYADSKNAAQATYHVDVASDAGFTSIIATSGDVASAATSYAFSASLTSGTTYYWRVRVNNGTSWSSWVSQSFGWDTSAPAIGPFTQPAANPTIVGAANAWTIAWPQVTSSSGISSLNVHEDYGPVVTPGTCADATPTYTTYQWAVAPTTTSWPVSNGSNGWCYWYYLDATNGVGTNAVGPTSNPVLLDTVVPAATFTWPPAGTTTTAIAPTVEWTEVDTASGVASRSLQRQVTTATAGVCGTTWTNDGTAVTAPSPAPQTTVVGACYRWNLTLTDAASNSATTTSGSLIRDGTAALGRPGYQSFESWSLGGGDELAVNVASGNAALSHSIVSLPIQGSSVSLGLAYNSQDSGTVDLGPGWRLNVERRLALNGDGTVTLVGADGSRATFTNPVTVGTVTTYTRPATTYATLVKDTSIPANEFVLTYRDQSRDKFDILGSEGILVRSEDRFANGVTLAYVAATNRISTITDTAGSRTITIAYDGSNRVSSITDWAYVDASGIVQTGPTGSHRVFRFFYDGSGNLAGWSDPLNTTATCPTGGSHLTCLTYTGGLLTAISKTQTVTTTGASALGTATQTATTAITYAGSSVATVKDAVQAAVAGGAGVPTTFTAETSTRVRVDYPTTTTLYGFVSAGDAYARTQSVWRRDTGDGVDIEQRTSWDTSFPAEPAWVAANYGGLLATPEVRRTYTYVTGSMGLVNVATEPLATGVSRTTTSTYNANNDVLTTTVAQVGGSGGSYVTQNCYTGLQLTRVIQNANTATCAGPNTQTADTNVTTDYTYDAYGQKTRDTRHNRSTTGAVLDDRATGFTYDTLGDQTSQIANYHDGVVTTGTGDTMPDATGALTDLTTIYTYDTAGNRTSSADPRRAIDLAIPNTQTISFTPTDDAHVRDAAPTTNYGTGTILEARATGGSQGSYEPYLKFTVTGLIGTVTGVTLRLVNTAVSNKSTRHVCLYRVADTTWSEATITNATKPAGDAASLVCVTGNQTAGNIDYVLPVGVITGPGVYAFKLTNDTTFDVNYASKENGTYAAPSLSVTLSYGPLAADDFVTRWTFDGVNEQLTEQTAKTFGLTDQKTSSQVFDELGNVRQATDTGGVVTGTAFDQDGRATTTFEDTDGAGAAAPAATSTTAYDADGHVTSVKDRAQVGNSNLGSTHHLYDSLGRELTSTDAYTSSPNVSSDSTTTYDALDRKVGTSVGGQDTAFGFDLAGRTLTTDDGFTCASSTFDVRDNQVASTSGLNGGGCSSAGAQWSTTTSAYDGLGRLLTTTVTSSWDGSGVNDRTTDVTLDVAGNKLDSKAYKAAPSPGETTRSVFTLNVLDELITQADTTIVGTTTTDRGTTKLNYDPTGNATDRCVWKPGITVGNCQVVGAFGWTTNLPSQNTSTTYDARNQRLQLVDGVTNATTVYDPTNNYQVLDVYTPTSSGKELQTLYGYDTRHRLVSLTNQVCTLSGTGHACASTVAAGSDTYTYDENDNRTRVTESNGSANLDRYYCYDARNQLTNRGSAAACSGLDETYQYDPAGNRTKTIIGIAPNPVTTTFDFSVDGQLCQINGSGVCPADPATWQVKYDDVGRTALLSGWSFLYDTDGRLVSACQATACTGTGFNRVDSTYDGDGHRTRIIETPASGTATTTTFVYQGDAVASETVVTGSATISRTFVTDDTGRITKATITDSANPGNNGTYLVTWNGHGDALGLWRQNADGTLTLANSYRYDTWGTPTTTVASGSNDLGFRYLYVGASDVQWDNGYGLGLLYMHARSYSPAIARFLEPDPARADGNLFVYAGNAPATKSDPSGSCWQFLAGGLATAETGVGAAAGAGLFLGCVGLGVLAIVFAARTGAMAGPMVGHILTSPWQLTAGRNYEQRQIRRLRLIHPVVVAPKFFRTTKGPRFLDACAYSDPFMATLAGGIYPEVCFEYKRSPGAAWHYYDSFQAVKDQAIRDQYPWIQIVVVWPH